MFFVNPCFIYIVYGSPVPINNKKRFMMRIKIKSASKILSVFDKTSIIGVFFFAEPKREIQKKLIY